MPYHHSPLFLSLLPCRCLTKVVATTIVGLLFRSLSHSGIYAQEESSSLPPLWLRKRVLQDVCLSQIGDDLTSGQADPDSFGWHVSISQKGTIVAVGARRFNGKAGIYSGLVQVFAINKNQWLQRGSNIEGENALDWLSANALSNNGNILAVGGLGNSDNGSSSGHVRVYEYNGSIQDYQQKGTTIVGLNEYDRFGGSVALSGDGTILAVGAHGFGTYGLRIDSKGQVRVFIWNTSSQDWVLHGNPIEGGNAGDEFGYSVSLSDSGTILAIGSYGTGGVGIFEFTTNDWNPLGSVLLDNIDSRSKVALSMDGYTVAMGQENVNDYRGQVQVFRWDAVGRSWTPHGSHIEGVTGGGYLHGDYLGNSVSLSGDASLLAIGAHGYDDRKGVLQMFQWEGSDWVQFGTDITGVVNGDDFGVSVAVSQDGSTFVGGAYAWTSFPSRPGWAKVFGVDEARCPTLAATMAPTLNPTIAPTATPTATPTPTPTATPTPVPTPTPTFTLVSSRSSASSLGFVVGICIWVSFGLCGIKIGS